MKPKPRKPKLKPYGETRLCIIYCDVHGFWGISIGDTLTGHRVTHGKCCGSWRTIKGWELSAEEWDDLAKRAKTEARRAGRGLKNDPL